MSNMRNKMSKLLMFVALLLTITACSDFLEVKEKGRTTLPVFFSDVDGLYAGLVGAYNKVYDYYDNEFSKYAEVAGNMASMKYVTAGSDMVDQYNFTSDPSQETGAVGYIWRRIYEALANVNNVIEYQPSVLAAYPTQEEKCRSILGEALFLRALCHFDLCRVYAQPYNYTSDASHLGVPVLLKTPGPDDNPSRKSVKEVYEQIIKDLDQAENLLNDITGRDIYHVSLKAVYALQSRVYLYMEDWSNSLKYAELAIGNVELAKGDEYLNMYRNLSVDGEAIFRLNGINKSGKLKSFYDTSCMPADTLFSLYDNADIRLNLLTDDATGTAYCSKYNASQIPNSEAKRDDPMVIRLSEVYLNAGEAACHLQDYTLAKKYLKAILTRAVDEAYADNTMNTYSNEDLIRLVKRERVKELCFEGHNFFDLIRWKEDVVRESRSNSSMKFMAYPSDYFVLPIPQFELNANKNMQPNPTVNN